MMQPAGVLLALVAAIAVIFWWLSGTAAALAAAFGGAIAAANIALLLWRRQRAADGPVLSAAQSMRLLYRTALERFVTVALLFALGMGVLQLDPLALLCGFVTGLVALLFTGTKGKSRHHGV